jgi:hypothetical protein
VLRHFVPRTHQNALCDPQIPQNAKTQVWCNVSWHASYGNRIKPTRACKIVHRHFVPRCTGIHYVTHKSHRVQKHKLCIICPGVLFMEIAKGPHEQEKCCIDFSCLRHTGIHYVTRISYRMQKHKIGVTCPMRFLWKQHRAHRSTKNSASTFYTTDVPECTTRPTDSTGLKNTSLA